MSIRFTKHPSGKTSALLGLRLVAQIVLYTGHYEIDLFDSAGATVRDSTQADSEEEAKNKVIAYVVAQRLEQS